MGKKTCFTVVFPMVGLLQVISFGSQTHTSTYDKGYPYLILPRLALFLRIIF